ncbi:MAG TPA: hypothetical protein VLV84_03865, partial [Candidatus Acidoferrales bacterium]|nr:hypothetical protein [Candidatus Acidoferrales bacterium]
MRIGFIVNPIAGMGGKVGFKGTDGVAKEALAKGAMPVAPQRAKEFLNALKLRLGDYQITLLCCPGNMGAIEAKESGFTCQILPMVIGEETSSADTQKGIALMQEANVDL